MTITPAQLEVLLGTVSGSVFLSAVLREWPEQFPRSIDAWWSFIGNIGKQYLCMKGGQTLPPPDPTQNNAKGQV